MSCLRPAQCADDQQGATHPRSRRHSRSCATVGERSRSQDQRQAADYLERVTGNRQAAGWLRDLVNLKDESHYGLGDVAGGHAGTAVRKAPQLVEAADAPLFP